MKETQPQLEPKQNITFRFIIEIEMEIEIRNI